MTLYKEFHACHWLFQIAKDIRTWQYSRVLLDGVNLLMDMWIFDMVVFLLVLHLQLLNKSNIFALWLLPLQLLRAIIHQSCAQLYWCTKVCSVSITYFLHSVILNRWSWEWSHLTIASSPHAFWIKLHISRFAASCGIICHNDFWHTLYKSAYVQPLALYSFQFLMHRRVNHCSWISWCHCGRVRLSWVGWWLVVLLPYVLVVGNLCDSILEVEALKWKEL